MRKKIMIIEGFSSKEWIAISDIISEYCPDNPLLNNPKVMLSPHTAAFTEECMTRMGKETIQNIIDFFDEKLDKSKIIKL